MIKTDFLGKLLEANQEHDKNKRISDIVDECKTFYFAGHETTTSLLGWTVLFLAVNQERQQKARKQVIELFGLTNPNADGISRLNIVRRSKFSQYEVKDEHDHRRITETISSSPSNQIKRQVKTQIKLGNLTLPPKIELYISPLAHHHDPNIWGEDVYRFRPERFAEGIVKAANNNPAAFFPFGFGRRTFVAITEAKIVLSMILERYSHGSSTTWSSGDHPENVMEVKKFYESQFVQ